MNNQILLTILKLVAVILLVLANGFFVAAEFALVSVRRTRVRELVARGNRSAKWVQLAIEDPDRVIAATQLGITLASLGLGWIGEPALSDLLAPLIALLPSSIQSNVSHSLSAGLAFAIITFLHVVVGELAPKSVALQNPERTSLAVARPTIWTERIFKPAIWVLNGAGNALLKLFGVEPASGHELVHSVEELKMLVAASAESGIVGTNEREMVRAVFDFGDIFVRQVMVPRTEVVAVPVDHHIQGLAEVFAHHPFTKVPVYEGDLDHVVGVVHIKDVLREIQAPDMATKTARDIMRTPVFVPESVRVDTLLDSFRTNRRHLAIVLDEYGGTAGVVTLEDLLEEIVGEVSDPFDTQPAEIQPLPDGSSLIDGLTLIDEVNEHFGLKLHNPHYDTIAGYVLGQLGRVAQLGDTIAIDGIRLRVEAMDGLRIAKVSLTTLDDRSEPQSSDETPE